MAVKAETKAEDKTEAKGDGGGEPRKYERNVQYGFEVVGELPPGGGESDGAGRRSPFEEPMDKIKEDADLRGKAVCVSKYKNRAAAAAAANVLRQRHGRSPIVEGWTFAVRKVNDGGGDIKYGLFFVYEPDKITDEGKIAHQKAEATRLDKINKKRAEDGKTPLKK